jgi:hypothetical protein
LIGYRRSESGLPTVAEDRLALIEDDLANRLAAAEQELLNSKAKLAKMALKLQQSTEVNISLQQDLGASNARCEILDARCQNLNLELEKVKKTTATESAEPTFQHEDRTIPPSNNPAQADSFYREKIELLNREIESRMANLCLSEEDDILSEDRAKQFLAILRTVHPHGSHTAAMFQTPSQVSAFHQDMRMRIVLVRHVLALLLWDRVFSSFAVGREIGISNCLREYEETKKLLSMNISSGELMLRSGAAGLSCSGHHQPQSTRKTNCQRIDRRARPPHSNSEVAFTCSEDSQ